jgi:hypothetical protein
MKLRPLALLLSLACAARVLAAEEPEQPKSRMKDILKARVAEESKDTKKKPLDPVLKPEAKSDAAAAGTAAATPAPASATPGPAAKAPPAAAPAKPVAVAQQPATMLPKVEVKKDRVTVLDHNLAVQEKEIAREKKNSTPTELDKALNDSKVSKALAIFGGQSGDHRAAISKERVQMMQEEKEVIEAIAHAKTKEEKAELQKQLDELKALRRDLEKSLR